jgi:hypothetical protein
MKNFLKKIVAVVGFFSLINATSEIEQKLVEHLQKSIVSAEAGHSKLTQQILGLSGMSSAKVRHLLNNICTLPESRYLEIGVWRGSTFVSALYGNENTLFDATAIDNWCEYGDTDARFEFARNVNQYLTKNRYKFLAQDSFVVNLNELTKEPINLYFYDGGHSFEQQKRALTYYYRVLADTFIFIVDDYNWKAVQDGTQAAIKELGLKIAFERILPAYGNQDRNNWWNGLYVAVLSKNK